MIISDNGGFIYHPEISMLKNHKMKCSIITKED